MGIPEEHLSQIFDPYFSTKEMGAQKGMGLGLAITYSIIHKHNGHITVTTEVGAGATFTIYLLAHEKDVHVPEPAKTLDPEKPETRTIGKILLMDDEKSIRKIARLMLSRLNAGYRSRTLAKVRLAACKSVSEKDLINALRSLQDEVLTIAHTSLRINTARVLLQIMKELVRSHGDHRRQLELAHDFRTALSGMPQEIQQEKGIEIQGQGVCTYKSKM